ncbi:MAG: nicotinate phosphoribosyltransferase [Candidatus Omnitrophica bacterium]|nr:nicotinate phosphoribosyltransferase [Candidatus Omnitrophota bacterium]
MKPGDWSLLVDFYELTMAQCYFKYKKDTRATFDLFVRDIPVCRSYLVASGIHDCLAYIRSLCFDKEALAYLKSLKIFSSDFLAYLKIFKFSGDVWAMPEGEIFFADEPVIRITAPIIEAQIIESFLLNTVNLQTMIASKASRVVQASQGKGVYDFSLRRTHGNDAGLKVSRASYLAGFNGTSNVLAGKMYNIPLSGTMAHSFVMSFSDEPSAFSAYSEVFPDRSILLVDTYDSEQGIKNAILTAKNLKATGHSLIGIRLDSGNIEALSRIARSLFDAAGLPDVKVFASGNLDEYRICELAKRKAPIDNFGVGTHMGVSIDAPVLDIIYKISEVTDACGNFLPTMKLSRNKITTPGRKQVYRIKNKQGEFSKDILALESEKVSGRPLLIKMIEHGTSVYTEPLLKESREYCAATLSLFPDSIKKIDTRHVFTVKFSRGLQSSMSALIKQFSRRRRYG